MEVNVAISIKVETYFGGRMYFVRGRKYFLLGKGNISSPRELCNGGDFIS